MKNKLFARVCAVLLVAALLMVGCSNGQAVIGPSNHSKYVTALGRSTEEACKIFGIRQEDMTEVAKGLYATPLTAEFAGQTFDVRLGINLMTEERELLQIVYLTVYPDVSDATIQAVDAIVAALKEQYGEPTRQSESRKKDERLPESHTYWDLTETVSEDLSAYMKQLEEEYGGPAHYQLELDIVDDEEGCWVNMKYIVGVIPQRNPSA